MGDVKGKNAVIVDDMVATAGSMVEAVEAIKKAGAKRYICFSDACLFYAARL